MILYNMIIRFYDFAMRMISVTDAARNFSDLIGRVFYQGESAVLLKAGKPVAKVTPIRRPKTGRDLATLWPNLPHLGAEEGATFEYDLEEARKKLPGIRKQWD